MRRHLVLLAVCMIAGFTSNPAFADDSGPQHHLVVYYLYMNPRCETCLNIEAFSKEAIEEGFEQELQTGEIEWHAYDIGQPEYEHFWDDFQLEMKSLVVADMRGDEVIRWKICDDVWDLVDDKPAFKSYVQNEVRQFLK